MNFDPLSQEERDAPFEPGEGIKGKDARPRDPRPFVRSSSNAPPPPARHPTLGVPADAYLYTDERGAPSLFVQRFEFPDATKRKRKRKVFIQWSLRQDTAGPVWVSEGFPEDEQLPLYNLPEIKASAPDALIVFVEGEKKVDAARVIFGASVVVTTAAMGAGSFPRTAATPLAGHPILIWPDNDAAGQGYARTVAGVLSKLGCEILIVDVAELVKIAGDARGIIREPDGWDCVDAIAEWENYVALRAKVLELAKPASTRNTTVPGGDPANQEKIRGELLGRIAALDGMDESGVRAIVVDAVKAGFSELAVETLIKPLAKKLGFTESRTRKFWEKIEKEIKAAQEELETKKREALAGEEREAKVREMARKLEEERAATRQQLESSCREIANDPELLSRLAKIARKAGVVGENDSLRGAYIAASSRFNCRKAMCLLRRGAPAGGKSHVTDRILLFIPEEDVVRVSSGSPLSLVYYGGEDEDALKHKIIYVAEAAILAERNGVESPLTIMLRLLISEGRIDHQVTVPRPNAPAQTEHIRRNGPVVVLITSARDNIEEEMLTRLMTADADESQAQTVNVLKAVLEDEEDEEAIKAEVDRWLDYQRWIAIDAPYDVVVPIRRAILRAILARQKAAQDRGEKPKFKLRIRRDIHGFLTAIKTSAILHKARREKDGRGRIIATLDDYRNAYEAFDPGLASLYKIASPLKTIAVVKAIEDMGATEERAVKVTVTALMEKLGITGRGRTNERLRDDEERGYIELVDKAGGYGKLHHANTKSSNMPWRLKTTLKLRSARVFSRLPSPLGPSKKFFRKTVFHPGTVVQRVQEALRTQTVLTIPLYLSETRIPRKIFRPPPAPTIPTVPTLLKTTINRRNRPGGLWSCREPVRHRREGASGRRHPDAQRRRNRTGSLGRRRLAGGHRRARQGPQAEHRRAPSDRTPPNQPLDCGQAYRLAARLLSALP
jgi:hypothetical protein